MRSCLLIVHLSAYTLGILFRKLSAVSMHSYLFSTFSSIKFNVSRFMVRSLIHLYLSFVQDDRYGSICILHATIQLNQYHCWRCFLFFHCIFLTSLSKIRYMWWIYVWVLNSIPLINMSVFMSIQCIFFIPIAL